MIANGKIRRAPASAPFRGAAGGGTDRRHAKDPPGNRDRSEQNGANGLIETRNSKGTRAQEGDVEKRERAKEDVADASSGWVHSRLLFMTNLDRPNDQSSATAAHETRRLQPRRAGRRSLAAHC